MAEDEGVIFSNLPRRRSDRVVDEDERAMNRAYRMMRSGNEEGPLPPRPHRSGVGGPSTNQGPPPPLPVNTVAPVASGTLTVGSTLSVTNGTWTNAPTAYAYQWFRGASFIAGANSATYVTVTADGGQLLTCTVTATNAVGSGSATSNALAIAIVAASGTTWNPSDQNSATLSNGYLTATAAALFGSARATASHTSGKYYYENTITATNNNTSYGVANASAVLSSMVVTPLNACLAYADGEVWINNVAQTTMVGVGVTTGTTVGVAVDLTANLIWFRLAPAGNWNGSGTANPATGIGGYSIASIATGPIFPACGFGNAGDLNTANFGLTSFAGAAPSGFVAWNSAPTGSTWSTADASANGMTLSNANLTVVAANTSAWQSIRGSISKTSGKLYVEFAVSNLTSAIGMIGLASAGFTVTSYLGNSNYSAGCFSNNNNYVSTGFTSNYVPSNVLASGDVWALAVDFTAGKIWLAQNNVWLNGSNPGTGSLPIISFVPATVGALFPGMSLQTPFGGTWTLQPTPASQTYLPPPGFQAWDGGPVTPIPASTWSTADASANGMTLSNGGMSVTQGATANRSIRGTNSHISGKWYVEFLANPGAAVIGNDRIGVADGPNFNIGNQIGNSIYSGGYAYGGSAVSAGFTGNYSPTPGNPYPFPGDVWALAVDFGAGSIWLAINNVWTNSSNPGTGVLPFISFVPATVGALFPALTMQGANEGPWTLQPTAASQKYAPPSGFSPWG